MNTTISARDLKIGMFVVGALVIDAAQARDRHQRLTLPIQLNEDRTERRHGLLQRAEKSG